MTVVESSRFGALAFLVLIAGCGGAGSTAKHVAGTATFDGKPIAYGQIEFIPDGDKKHTGPAGSAEIVDGKFDTKAGGQGIHFGPHQVRITAYEGRPPATGADETAAVDSPPPLFVGYSMAMDISTPEVAVAVPPDAKGFNLFGSGKSTRRSDDP